MRPLPLGGLVVLERDPRAVGTAHADVDDPAATLLGNAFLPYLERRERLARQLDVMSAIARTVPMTRLRIGAGAPPAAVAARVRAWVEDGA